MKKKNAKHNRLSREGDFHFQIEFKREKKLGESFQC